MGRGSNYAGNSRKHSVKSDNPNHILDFKNVVLCTILGHQNRPEYDFIEFPYYGILYQDVSDQPKISLDDGRYEQYASYSLLEASLAIKFTDL